MATLELENYFNLQFPTIFSAPFLIDVHKVLWTNTNNELRNLHHEFFKKSILYSRNQFDSYEKSFSRKYTEKVYFRSQILECPSIGQYWIIFGVPVLPENVVLTFFKNMLVLFRSLQYWNTKMV